MARNTGIGLDVMIAAGSPGAGNIPAQSVCVGIRGASRAQALRQPGLVRRQPGLAGHAAGIRRKLGL